MMRDTTFLIIWVFIGLVKIFATENISKFSYFLVWIALMTQLLGNVIRHL